MSEKVTLYTMDYCPYCVAAKKLLEQRSVPYQEILLDKRKAPEKFQELAERSGMRTLPQIFNGEDLIGGYDQLAALDKSQGLDHLKA